MSFFWIATISLHLFAAAAWIGGMVFLSFALAPLVRSRHSTSEAVALFRSAARRFRLMVWVAMAALFVTGPVLLIQRHIAIMHPATWPQVVAVKLGLVATLLLLTAAHDLVLGPKVSQITDIPACARTSWEQTLVRSVRWVPRLSLLIALAIIVAATILARS